MANSGCDTMTKYVYYVTISTPAMMNEMANLNLMAHGPSDGLNAYKAFEPSFVV